MNGNEDLPMKSHPSWKPYWNGEPTVLAFLKATNDALEWMNENETSTKTGYGVSVLINQAQEFLSTYKPASAPHSYAWRECICELCAAERTLRLNIKKLEEL